jgi:hypothetical protein
MGVQRFHSVSDERGSVRAAFLKGTRTLSDDPSAKQFVLERRNLVWRNVYESEVVEPLRELEKHVVVDVAAEFFQERRRRCLLMRSRRWRGLWAN